MFNCDWAKSLTSYDCRPLTAVDGSPCVEIGTPFSLPDGSAINVYLKPEAQFIRVSDNGDTLFQLGGMGLDVWSAQVRASLAGMTARHQAQLTPEGEIFLLVQESDAPVGFALAVAAALELSSWAAERLMGVKPERSLAEEAEPFVIARNPAAPFKRHFHVKGVSRADHVFDFRHGRDLIDVIPPHATATGAAMRKAGDVQNGPFASEFQPLIIVDDRLDEKRAFNELEILGSLTRAMPLSRLMHPPIH